MKIINSKLILIIFLSIILITGIFFLSGCELIEEGSNVFDYLSNKAMKSGLLPIDSGLSEEDVRVLKLNEAAYEAEEEYRKEKEKKMEESKQQLLKDDTVDIEQITEKETEDLKDTKSEPEEQVEKIKEESDTKKNIAIYKGWIEGNNFNIDLKIDFNTKTVSGTTHRDESTWYIVAEIKGKIDLSNYEIDATCEGYHVNKENDTKDNMKWILYGELSEDLKIFRGTYMTDIGVYTDFSIPRVE